MNVLRMRVRKWTLEGLRLECVENVPEYVRMRQKMYRMRNPLKPYKGDTTEDRCSSKNAILAHAESEDQLDAIKSHFDEDTTHLWIGLKKKPGDNGGYEANQVVWIKTGEDYQFSNFVPVETNEDGDECVAVQVEPAQAEIAAGNDNAAGDLQYKIVDKDCNDRFKVLCQKQCGGEQGEVA